MRQTLKKTQQLAREIDQWQQRLAPELSDVDSHDLHLILWSMLRRKYDGRAHFQPVPKRKAGRGA